MPVTGDGEMAAGTIAFAEMIFEDVVPGAAEEQGVARGTKGVGGVRENVAFVDVVQADFASDGTGAMEGGGRSSRLVAKFEIGMESGEVERDVGAEMREDPFGELASFCGIVVESGNHEIGEFEPHGGFVLEPLESLEDGLEVGERDLAIEIFGERFEVHIGGIDVVVDVVESFAGDVAVGDHDGFQAVKFGGFANVDDVFAPDGGLVVGEGDGVAPVLEGKLGDVFGRDVARVNLIVMGFGNVPVLAEEAAHIAARSAHAEDAGAGQEMIEGLFLDGVNLESGGSAVAEVEEFSVLIDTDEAET